MPIKIPLNHPYKIPFIPTCVSLLKMPYKVFLIIDILYIPYIIYTIYKESTQLATFLRRKTSTSLCVLSIYIEKTHLNTIKFDTYG